MSKTTNRETPPSGRASADDRLARLLETPLLARVVPQLAPETLHQLIQHRGLEACGELVTLATPKQLATLLDLDLWRHSRPGRDEQFDADRFGEWLEVLVENGESAAARTVAGIDAQLVVVGLSRYLRVFDPGTFEPTAPSDDEMLDRHEKMNSETCSDVLECEVGGYLVRARRTDAWDAIVSLLVTLEDEHSDYFHAVMHGCRRLSNSTPELDGLDDLLLAPEQHLHDEAIERERRRSRQGYATPADARAFLQMARRPQRPPHQSAATHPIVAPYFRATDEPSDEPIDEEEASAATAVPAERDQDVAASKMRESIETVVELLTETGVMPQRPRALLAAAEEDPRAARLAVLRRSMAFVLEHDETAYMARSRELAFLANTLLAGCSVQSRPFTAAEASDAAACICNLGLECWTSRPGSTLAERGRESLPDAFLVDHDLIAAFEVGWSVLYEDVSLFAADRLIATLSEFQGADADTRDQLRGLQRTLTSAREAGTPWRARDAADVLAMLDTTAWISVVGLLDECPILPEALTAVLERRTTPVSPTAFEFISTAAQLGDIRLFMTTLASVLAR